MERLKELIKEYGFQFSLARSVCILPASVSAVAPTFNSLLRDQGPRVNIRHIHACLTFNSLLRDQLIEGSLGKLFKFAFQFSLARSGVGVLGLEWWESVFFQFSLARSVVGWNVGFDFKHFVKPFNSLLRDQRGQL